MGAFASVFFEVGPSDANRPGLAVDVDGYLAFANHRFVILADLITFGQVGIKVMLTVKFTEAFGLGAQRQRRLSRQVDSLVVEHRQRTRQAKIYMTDQRVRWRLTGIVTNS